MYLRELIARPFVKTREMQADMLRDYMVKVSGGQCARAKSIARLEIEGCLNEHCAKIWDYAYEILRTNPGSSVKVGGLVEAVKDLLPRVEHRKCARHIYANFKKKFNGVQFRNLFWAASKMSLEHELVSIMDKIKSIDIEAFDHLIERDPNTWSRAFFETDRACESVENGISESFNSVILNARRKPIITMLEEIRMFLMERNYKMSKKSHKWDGKFCCYCFADFATVFFFFAVLLIYDVIFAADLLLNWIVIPSGGNAFEVRNVYEAYTVDLDNRECSCRLWQISGLPSLHSVSAMYYINNDPEDYASDWFRVEKFKETYTHYMKPLNGSKMWKSTPYIQPLPPNERRMPGRP
ncbi:uncharacterized protein LOC143594136 [Bidens hawaiensis]|uniref:uncharacterized protein LOC143594136 n=1 Tax=Bidens hawaiensis TaxID=980011 RepID=UPI00404933C6